MLQDHPWHKAGLSTITKKTDEVTWYYDDHKTNERITINETGRELMKKMIIHIPETGFHMVRYYGFGTTSRKRTHKIDKF